MATALDETNAAADTLTDPAHTSWITRLPNAAGMGDSNKTEVYPSPAGGAANPAGTFSQ